MSLIRFNGQLRPSQQEVVEIAKAHLAEGKRRLHIVAPPGSGKTVLGLYIWAEMIGAPALVLSPNSAIQAQWAGQTKLFQHRDLGNVQAMVSTSVDQPGMLTSLTYQSITMPARATEHTQQRALDLWIENLLNKDQAESNTEAEVWIEGLRQHNPDFFNERLSHYRKRIRKDDAMDGLAMSLLHQSCLDTLIRLRDYGVGLLILDECHHLMGHWGRVLAEVSEYLGDPMVLGLTATPPDQEGKDPADVERYHDFFGPIDFEVPVPAVVKDGFLAPYQDLAYFVRPAQKELQFIGSADQQFAILVEELCTPQRAIRRGAKKHESLKGQRKQRTASNSKLPSDEPLPEPHRESLLQWLTRVITDKQLPTTRAADWRKFYVRDPEFATAAIWFLQARGQPIPQDVPPLIPSERTEQEQLITLIDRYTRHYLRRSPHKEDHRLATRAVDRLRMLGVQITDVGTRGCASPVSRVIAYTRQKTNAVVTILQREMDVLGDTLRAVVIADFEKTSAISSEVAHLLDEEAGGAVAAFRTLLEDPKTNQLEPVLLTGSSVLVDIDVVTHLLDEAEQWLAARSIAVELRATNQGAFCEVNGSGSDWCPRVYVEMITELFQRGLTRCLVGTRGLLGEGWDANTINVLIDLSTVTTSMTVNQLRGRSIRLDPNQPRKLANNWDVVCIAPEFSKGLDDYGRFIRKHQTIFGICDDGAIEKGVGHVHAALTELQPELVDGSAESLNRNMLARAGKRFEAYERWQIGKPYRGEPIRAIEVGAPRQAFAIGYPPFAGTRQQWTMQSLAAAISQAVLSSLLELNLITSDAALLRVTERDGGYVRIYLQDASAEDADTFAAAVHEVFSPLLNPRYVIPRAVDLPRDTFTQRWLPKAVSRFFERRDRHLLLLHAVPSVLATRRTIVDVFQQNWNEWVSPGEAIFVKNESGQQLIYEAIQEGITPATIVHSKELFI